MKAVGYTRLSQDGLSIPDQKEKIRAYCERVGFDLVKIYDDGERSSGFSTDERPEYVELRARVREGDVDAVVVRDTGRIGRDFDERMYFVLDCRRAGIELHSDEYGQHDLSNPWSVLQETAQAAGDDVQKRHEIERSKEVTRQRIENGCYHGTPPFGLRFAADKCHLEKHPNEWETVEEVYELLDEGNVYRTIEAETGVSISSISRLKSRGRGYYSDLLQKHSA